METRTHPMTRRALVGMVGLAAPSLWLTRSTDAAASPDPVVAVVVTELLAMVQRAAVTPHHIDGELMRAIASTFRVIDAVATAHDLKRHMTTARRHDIEVTDADRLAERLRAHGGPTLTGDDLWRRHFEARARLTDPARVEHAAVALITSGQIFQQTAAVFEALAASPQTGGIALREPRRGLEDEMTRQATSWSCWVAPGYATNWGLLLGWTGFVMTFIPPLEVLALGYTGVGLLFDVYALWCSNGEDSLMFRS